MQAIIIPCTLLRFLVLIFLQFALLSFRNLATNESLLIIFKPPRYNKDKELLRGLQLTC